MLTVFIVGGVGLVLLGPHLGLGRPHREPTPTPARSGRRSAEQDPTVGGVGVAHHEVGDDDWAA